MFFRDILTIPTVTKNIYTLKFPFSLQEKGDCDHIRTLFIDGKNTAYIAFIVFGAEQYTYLSL